MMRFHGPLLLQIRALGITSSGGPYRSMVLAAASLDWLGHARNVLSTRLDVSTPMLPSLLGGPIYFVLAHEGCAYSKTVSPRTCSFSRDARGQASVAQQDPQKVRE